MADPEYGAVTITKRTSSTFITDAEKQEGEHVVSTGLVRLNREWQPKDKATQRFKDDVIKKVEQVLNNTSSGSAPPGGGGSPGVEPDLFYDTGYFLVNKNESVDKSHNLGQVPTRYTFFMSSVPNPIWGDPGTEVYVKYPGAYKYGVAGAYIWSGFTIEIKNDNEITIHTQPTSVHGTDWDSGYLRIMMWR